ncbi:MAG: hypothetical protein KC613_17855 [Myxococcales bacterium]|nr:hypothetical protein [Myxococcales bacterium]
MGDHPTPTPAGFADELARMVVDAYARRMGEHTGAAAELDAVREALGCDEGETTVDAVRRLLSEVDAADRATNVALEGAAGLRKQVADLKRDLKRDGLTDDEWRRVHKALKVDNKPDALREIARVGRTLAERDAAMSAIAAAGLKAAQVMGVERVEDIPSAAWWLRGENERLRAELAAATNTPREAAESE